MAWTVLYFRGMENRWMARAVGSPIGPEDKCDGEENLGLKCYAYRQSAIWSKFADHAAVQFSSANMKLKAKEGNAL
jgi:hypothetical protein